MTSTSHDPRAWQRPEDSAARPASARLVDPEDDLPPSSTYAGDFETTAIPRYDSNPPNPERAGYGLLHDPEPLPYVQPAGRYQTPPSAEPTEIEPDVGFGTSDQQGRRVPRTSA